MPPPPARASDETLTLTMTPFPEAQLRRASRRSAVIWCWLRYCRERALSFERVHKRPAHPVPLISRQAVVTNWVSGSGGWNSPMVCTGPRRPGR